MSKYPVHCTIQNDRDCSCKVRSIDGARCFYFLSVLNGFVCVWDTTFVYELTTSKSTAKMLFPKSKNMILCVYAILTISTLRTIKMIKDTHNKYVHHSYETFFSLKWLKYLCIFNSKSNWKTQNVIYLPTIWWISHFRTFESINDLHYLQFLHHLQRHFFHTTCVFSSWHILNNTFWIQSTLVSSTQNN